MADITSDSVIGIIGALEEEIKLLRGLLKDTQAVSIGNYEFTKGLLENRQVVLLCCGIGKVQAAAGCAILIERFKPSLIINIGAAGGLDKTMSLGDVIIASGLLYHDVNVTALNFAPGQIPGQPEIFSVSEELIVKAERAVNELKAEKLLPASLKSVRGLVGSGDSFVCEDIHIESLKKTFPELKAVEMEGAAIAHTCALLNTPCLIIRALSDIAGTESPVSFEQFLPLAAKHSAEIVRRFIVTSG